MSTGFRARVLVAEDEEFTLNLLREVLEGANFQVEAVKTVAEAIALVASFDPHVVITDLNFGVGPSGAELVEAGDPVALARAIEELSKQPEKLADLAARGRVFADANLAPEVGRKKYLDWVQKLIQSK